MKNWRREAERPEQQPLARHAARRDADRWNTEARQHHVVTRARLTGSPLMAGLWFSSLSLSDAIFEICFNVLVLHFYLVLVLCSTDANFFPLSCFFFLDNYKLMHSSTDATLMGFTGTAVHWTPSSFLFVCL